MHAAGRFLRGFDPEDRQLEVAAEALAEQLFWGQMPKKIATDDVQRDNRLAAILRQEKKQGWRATEIAIGHAVLCAQLLASANGEGRARSTQIVQSWKSFCFRPA